MLPLSGVLHMGYVSGDFLMSAADPSRLVSYAGAPHTEQLGARLPYAPNGDEPGSSGGKQFRSCWACE
jgi:hypothetical protein